MRRTTKRLLAALLAFVLLTLCACSAEPAQSPEPAQESAQTEPSQEAPAKTPDEPAQTEPEASSEQIQPEPAEAAEPEAKSPESAPQTPEERPPMDEQPASDEAQEAAGPATCTVSIRCASLLDHMSDLDAEKAELVPQDGWILAPTTVEFSEGQSAFEVLLDTVKANAIHMEYQATALYDTAYIEGIGGIYEFDCGALSGWMYRVNGWFPNYGSSRYGVQAGDTIEWVYSCDLGVDVGASGVSQGYE